MSDRDPCFDQVNAAALAAYPGLLERWFPNGRRRRSEFCLGSVQREAGQSLSINTSTGIWKDFATGESGTDPVSLYAAIHGLGQVAARDELAAELGLVGANDGTKSGRQKKGSRRADSDNTDRARAIWKASHPAADTPVERYLASRGITMKPPPTIRFHPGLKHGPTGLLLPAMVAAVTVWPRNEVVAIHRTFLKADGSDKAPITQNKMMLGPCAGGAVRLAASGDELVLAEGLETAMSVLQATGKPTWATLSTSGLKSVRLPPEVQTVIIAADGDQPGEDAAMIAAERIVAEGRRVKIARPPWGLDFNDLLRAEGLATLAALAGGGRDI